MPLESGAERQWSPDPIGAERSEVPMNIGDETLMQRYQAGDRSALEHLYLKYQGPLFNYIRRWVNDTARAEDILQEAFIRVINNARSFVPTGDGSFGGWLYKITTNLCKDKQRSRHQSLTKYEQRTTPKAFGGPRDYELDDKVQQSLDTLAPEQKEVVMLRVYGGLSFKEISKVQDAPLNTVLARMHYALKNLRQKFGISHKDTKALRKAIE